MGAVVLLHRRRRGAATEAYCVQAAHENPFPIAEREERRNLCPWRDTAQPGLLLHRRASDGGCVARTGVLSQWPDMSPTAHRTGTGGNTLSLLVSTEAAPWWEAFNVLRTGRAMGVWSTTIQSEILRAIRSQTHELVANWWCTSIDSARALCAHRSTAFDARPSGLTAKNQAPGNSVVRGLPTDASCPWTSWLLIASHGNSKSELPEGSHIILLNRDKGRKLHSRPTHGAAPLPPRSPLAPAGRDKDASRLAG